MPSIKEVKNKIEAVKKTKQITKAMNMVATSRLRGAQQNMDAFRPYARKFADVLGSVADKTADDASPLLIPREEVKKQHIVLCTSDRGLCGGFNMHLINTAAGLMAAQSDGQTDISFTAFGKKGRDWCRNQGLALDSEQIGVVGSKIGFNIAVTEGRRLVERFLSGQYGQVHVVYAEYINVAKQVPVVKQLLPIPPIETVEKDDKTDEFQVEHIYEPSAQEILGSLLPRNVHVQLFSALLETSTSEHAARMTAMENASKACDDMQDSLTLVYNKARQAAITAELMDIVGGAEALRG